MSTPAEDQRLQTGGRLSGLVGVSAAPFGYVLGVAVCVVGTMEDLAPMTGQGQYLGLLAAAAAFCWALGLIVGLVGSVLARRIAARVKSGGDMVAGLGLVGFASCGATVSFMLLTVVGTVMWATGIGSGLFL